MKPLDLLSLLLRTLRRQAILAYLKRHPMPEDLPERLTREPNDRPPRTALIWLHGIGTSAGKFMREYPPPHLLACRVIALQAPIRPVSIMRGHRLPAWADLLPNGARPALINRQHIEESAARIHREIGRQRQDGIRQIVLGGHSQGGLLALYAALTHREPVSAIISFSGILPESMYSRLGEHPEELRLDVPVFLAHGARDMIFLLKRARETRDWLQRHGASVRLYSGPYGHNKRPAEEMQACQQFLAAHLT